MANVKPPTEGIGLPPECVERNMTYAERGDVPMGMYHDSVYVTATTHPSQHGGEYLRHYFSVGDGKVVTHITGDHISTWSMKHPDLKDISEALGVDPTTLTNTIQLEGRRCKISTKDSDRYVEVIDIQPLAQQTLPMPTETPTIKPDNDMVKPTSKPVCPLCAARGIIARFENSDEVNRHLQEAHR